jgi:dihydrofolate reductase
MGRTIVIEFITVDGIVEDPDGSAGTAGGGWAFRHGPEAVAGDKFRLGDALDRGTLLLGRRTWELFSGIWPNRTDPFAVRMNAVPKVVASRTRRDLDGWANSTLAAGPVVEVAEALRERGDVVVAGSVSVAHALIAAGRVDEYRLLVFPIALGSGTRLFPGATSTPLALSAAEPAGPALLCTYVPAPVGAGAA